MDNKIIEKIQKLLNLSESSNENEAKVSMLKAQELLAKYKLSQKEVEAFKPKKSEIKNVVSNVTFRSAKWKAWLATVIADNFGCYSYTALNKTYKMYFFGREEDVQVCNIMLDYAIDCIESTVKSIKYSYIKKGISTKGLMDNYAIGFVTGLEQRFEEQKKANQEWGLVLIKDIEVTNKYNEMNFTKKKITQKLNENTEMYERGFEEGLNFSISDRIEQGKMDETIMLG